MENLQDQFNQLYNKMELNDENSYDNSFQYTKNNSGLLNLNYVYLISKKIINYFQKSRSSDMIEEEGSQIDTRADLDNSDLLSIEEIKNLKFRSKFQNFSHLFQIIKDIPKTEIIMVNKQVFDYIKTKLPMVKEIKKVVHFSNGQIIPEIHNRIALVLFLNNQNLKRRIINRGNFQNYTLNVPISQFMNAYDLQMLMKEICRNYFKLNSNSFQDNKLLLPNCAELNQVSFRKLIDDSLTFYELKKENISHYAIYNRKVIVFSFKSVLDDWFSDFDIQKKKIKKNHKFKCFECKNKLNNLENLPFCLCERFFCNEQCQNKQEKHECEKQKCALCEADLNSSQVQRCKCGAFYCCLDCKTIDNEKHQKQCSLSAYKKYFEVFQEYLENNQTTINNNNDDEQNDDNDNNEHNDNEQYSVESIQSKSEKQQSNSSSSDNDTEENINVEFQQFKINEESEEELEDLNLKQDNRGTVGLNNLGNTCYMNSALQILVHLSFVKELFSKNNLIINKENNLGTKGEMVQCFKNFMIKYWKTLNKYVAPYDLKAVIGKHIKQFQNYDQHDSQEFLLKLFEKLHGDLNLIRNRKAIEEDNNNVQQQTEFQIARQFWLNFIQNDYSPFVQKMYGQFKQTDTCQQCKMENYKFNPFVFLSLSVPFQQTKNMFFYYLYPDQNRKQVKYQFNVSSFYKFRDIKLDYVKNQICQKLELNPDQHCFALLGFSMVGEILDEFDSLDKMIQKIEMTSSKLKLFLSKLNEHEIDIKQQKDSLPIYFQTNFEIDDENFIQKEQDMIKYQEEIEKNKKQRIFTKFSFISQNCQLKDIYPIVLRKFFHVTSLFKMEEYQNKKNQRFFNLIWKQINEKIENQQFFYLKYQDEEINPNSDIKIQDIHNNQEKLVIQIFLKRKCNTTVEVACQKFLKSKIDNNLIEINQSQNSDSGYHLDNLINNFCSQQTIDDSLLLCSNCNTKQRFSQQHQLYKIPEYLFIFLKRNKNLSNELITFPIDSLDLNNKVINKKGTEEYQLKAEEIFSQNDLNYYADQQIDFMIPQTQISENKEYQLLGIVNHTGGQNFGHYFANFKVGNLWYEFNDMDCHQIDQNDIITENAYLLVYQIKQQQKQL